jgi:hypothetical protein
MSSTTMTINTTNPNIQTALDTITGTLLGYLSNPGPHCLNPVINLINDYVKQFDEEFLNSCDFIFNEINKYGKITPQLFLQKIDAVIDILLSYDIKTNSGAYRLGSGIAHYKLLERCFQNGVKPGWPENNDWSLPYILQKTHPIAFIINSHRTEEEIINILSLYLYYGYDMNHYNGDFIMSCKLDVIKFIISKIEKSNWLHNIVDTLEYNEAPLNKYIETIDYIVMKTKEDYGIDGLQPYLYYCCFYYNNLYPDKEQSIVDKYKYLIRTLIINGADINIPRNGILPLEAHNPFYYSIVRNNIINVQKRHDELYNTINDLIVTNTQATQIVDNISSVVLPDIAKVVFDNMYCYKFSEASEQIVKTFIR